MSYAHNRRKKAIKRKQWAKGRKNDKLAELYKLIKEHQKHVAI